jgi:hypothetical protein
MRRASIVGSGGYSIDFSMGLNPAPITPTVPQAPCVIPDGRISRVRLATMTFSRSLPKASRWFKCSPTCTPETPVCRNARYACAVHPLNQAQCPESVPKRTRHGRESLRAFEALPRRPSRLPPRRPALPSPPRYYRLMRRSRLLSHPSFQFGWQSSQVAVNPCCNQDLPNVTLLIFPHVLGPLPRLPPRCIRSFLPSERWPSPPKEWVGASQFPNSYSS